MMGHERTCSVEACQRRHLALGYCKPHYRSFKAHGDPLKGLKRYQQFTAAQKVCARCGQWKPLEEFSPAPRNRSGRASYCHPCQNDTVQAAHAHRTPEQVEKARRRRQRRTLASYGITSEEYEAILDRQGGGCVCGTRPVRGRRFHVDHDHSTGRVRGILCHGCNTALGLAGEDPARLRLLADYLDSGVAHVPDGSRSPAY